MAETDKAVQKAEPKAPAKAEAAIDRLTFAPPVDIYETDDAAVLAADVPGCGEGNVDVSLEEGVLTVRGRVEPDRFPDHELTYAEYRVGDYERTFSVSDTVDVGKVEASVKDGVLRLVLPKAPEAKPKRIAIKTG